MQVTIPALTVVFIESPLERVHGNFTMSSVPKVGDIVKVINNERGYFAYGEVLRVVWTINVEVKDSAYVEVFFKNVAPQESEE